MKKLLRGEGVYSFLSSLAAILIGLLLGFVVLLVANPGNALAGLRTLLVGGFKNPNEVGRMLAEATPIIFTGLSVGFANKCGLFNIGGPGQFIVGAYAAVYIGVNWTFLPGHLLWITALAGAALAGAIWGLVPGLMKALAGVNEGIACIMMNYIGMSVVNLLVRRTVYDAGKSQSKVPVGNAILPRAGLDKLFSSGNATSTVNIGILIAIGVGIVMYIVLNKTRFGFELKAVGLNRDAAKYAGVNEKRSIILSMANAGALAALGGAMLYLAGSGKGIAVLDQLAAEGFNGIPVALLGMNNPIAILFSGTFIAHLTRGGFNLQSLGFVPQVIDIITAVIIYFAAFSLFFRAILQRAARLGGRGSAPAQAEETIPTPETQAGGGMALQETGTPPQAPQGPAGDRAAPPDDAPKGGDEA